MPLARVIDLIGRNTHIDEFLPPLAASLRTVANFDVLGVVVPHDEWRTAQLISVRIGAPDGASTVVQVQSMAVAPLDRARLAALAATGSPAMVFDRLDEPDDYADVIAALRGFGQQSACLLPLATALDVLTRRWEGRYVQRELQATVRSAYRRGANRGGGLIERWSR